MGPVADPEEAASAGSARHASDIGRADERHQLRCLRPARGAGVLRRRPAGAGAGRRRDRAGHPGAAPGASRQRGRACPPPRRVEGAAAPVRARVRGDVLAVRLPGRRRLRFQVPGNRSQGGGDRRAGNPLKTIKLAKQQEGSAMDMPINTFKRAIKEGRQQIGLWSSLSSHISVEILAASGFDWLLIDTEHSPNDLPMVYSQLQAAVGGTAHPIVRPPWNDMVTIKRYLDAGVQTFLIPYVQNAEEARQAVASTHYPPDGIRGFASASRASRFGRVKDYYARAAEEICVLVQIETQEALGHLEEIANVPGVDGVFIGPGD